jgi:hypothetical protein
LEGLSVFWVVYRFYPEKRENINLNGRCYELTGQAHEEFVKLTAEQKKNGLILQLNKIEEINARIPVTFTGPAGSERVYKEASYNGNIKSECYYLPEYCCNRYKWKY